MANRGIEFEEQFRASVPPGVECRKLNSPAPPAGSMEQIVAIIQRLSRLAGEEVAGWVEPTLRRSTFTAKQPYDLLLLAPVGKREGVYRSWWLDYLDLWQALGGVLTVSDAMGREAFAVALGGGRGAFGGPVLDLQGVASHLPATLKITFALELKSAGRAKSIAFDRIKPNQETGLRRAAEHGSVSGVVVDFPDVGPDGEVLFIPIASWLAYKRGGGRASLPLEAARTLGIAIPCDPDRGRIKRYYDLRPFLRHFGADVPEPKQKGVRIA